jgi:uncharacterized protein with HEPN domain
VKRSHLVRLDDILEAIDAVAEMIGNRHFGQYRVDYQLRRAVERCVEIVSEASRRLPPALTAQFPEQPWPEIAAIGNLLRHEYQRVDDFIMWKIATISLPALRPAVAAMIEVEQSNS